MKCPHRSQFHPLLRIRLQQPCQHLPRLLADMPRHLIITRAYLLEHVLTRGTRLERILASQHEEEQHAESPGIDGHARVLLVLHNLRSSVPFRAPFNSNRKSVHMLGVGRIRGCSALQAQPVTWPHQLADAEIDYFDDEAAASPAAAAGVGHRYYKYVVQLDVSEMSVTCHA
jgi:hypothetical protein